MTLPEYNFLLDDCLGIIKSRSVICLQMARSLNEKVTVKKICERFTRHLNKQELGAKLRATINFKQCRGFDSDTAIIVDDSDIVKSKAKFIEGLKLVRYGSTGTHDKLGYDLLNIFAAKTVAKVMRSSLWVPISSPLTWKRTAWWRSIWPARTDACISLTGVMIQDICSRF